MDNKLKELRNQNKIEIEEISKLLGVSKKTYLKYELYKKNIPLSILIKLSHIYNTSIDYLICETDNQKRHSKISKN